MTAALLLALCILAAPSRAQVPALIPLLRPAMGAVPLLGPTVPVRPPAGVAQRVYTLVPSSPARAAEEQALFAAASALLESTQEGSRILADLESYGVRIPVSFVHKAGSGLSRGTAKEELRGVGGSFKPSTGEMQLNELYLVMRDQASAQASVAMTLAHESEHARLRAAARRLTPGLEAVLTIDAANERNAFLSEYLVASELGVETSELESARSLVADAPAYWEKNRLGGALYALALTLDEMADPVAAWTGRLAKLKTKLADAREEVQSGIPWTRKTLKHMESAHGAVVSHLSEELESDFAFLSARIDTLQDSVDFLESRIAKVSDPAVRSALDRDLALAAATPGYRAFTDLVADKTTRLAAGLPPAPATASPTPAGRLTWKDFYRLVDEDRDAHPEHWAPDSPDPVALGPTWKILVAELSGLPRG